MEQLTLEGGDERLGQGVVESICHRSHRREQFCFFEPLAKLHRGAPWLPLSEWCTSPGAGRRLCIAMLRASNTSSVLRWTLAIDQPTTLREKASSQIRQDRAIPPSYGHT